MLVRRTIPALLFLGALAACGGSPPPAAPPPVPTFGAQSGYARVSGEVLDWYFARHPAIATSLGEHAYDTTLGAYFAGDLERAKRDARALLTRLETVNRPTLAREDYFDHRLLEYALRGELLDLEEIGGWQRDPVRYVHQVSTGTYALLGSDFEGGVGVESMIERWRRVPLLFRAARQNLVAAEVPPLFVRQAIEAGRGVSQLLDRSVPTVAAPGLAGLSAARRAEWDAARRLAIASTDSFVTWLERDFGPRATGDFRLGADALERYLLYVHHEAVDLEQLQQINRQAIAEHGEWLERVALELDPLTHPRQLVASIIASDPDAGLVLPPSDHYLIAPESRARRATSAHLVLDPLGQFLELSATDSEAMDGRARVIAIRRALHAHALVHAMIMLHAGNGTIDAVTEDVANIAMVDRERARQDVERVAYDPGYALVGVGRMELFALREQLRVQAGGSFDPNDFTTRLLDLGLPVPLAAEALLGHEPQPMLVAGRRTPGIPEPPRRLQ